MNVGQEKCDVWSANDAMRVAMGMEAERIRSNNIVMACRWANEEKREAPKHCGIRGCDRGDERTIGYNNESRCLCGSKKWLRQEERKVRKAEIQEMEDRKECSVHYATRWVGLCPCDCWRLWP